MDSTDESQTIVIINMVHLSLVAVGLLVSPPLREHSLFSSLSLSLSPPLPPFADGVYPIVVVVVIVFAFVLFPFPPQLYAY